MVSMSNQCSVAAFMVSQIGLAGGSTRGKKLGVFARKPMRRMWMDERIAKWPDS